MLRSRIVMTGFALLLVFGCGSEQYESRLNETNAFFEYRQSLDRVLQTGNWSVPLYGLTMRIPKGFNYKPGPPPPKGDEPAAEDTRQPTFLGLQLPGLMGAWQGDFPSDGGNRPVFLYVCSNHQTYLNAVKNLEGPDPALFLTDLENLLSSTMQVSLPPQDVVAQVGNNIRYDETCPRDGKYALQKKFTGITFVPPGVLPQLSDSGVEIKAQLYTHYNGPIQVAVLAIYPAGIRDRIEDKLLKSLETFSVSNQLPKVQGGSATGPSGTSGKGF